MRTVLNFIADSIQENFLHPARFIRKIKNHPPLSMSLKIPPRTADSTQIIHWNRWDNPNFYKNHILHIMERYGSTQQYIPELEYIVTVNVIKNWQCDIRDIDCLAASKSNLSLFKTLNKPIKGIRQIVFDDVPAIF